MRCLMLCSHGNHYMVKKNQKKVLQGYFYTPNSFVKWHFSSALSFRSCRVTQGGPRWIPFARHPVTSSAGVWQMTCPPPPAPNAACHCQQTQTTKEYFATEAICAIVWDEEWHTCNRSLSALCACKTWKVKKNLSRLETVFIPWRFQMVALLLWKMFRIFQFFPHKCFHTEDCCRFVNCEGGKGEECITSQLCWCWESQNTWGINYNNSRFSCQVATRFCKMSQFSGKTLNRISSRELVNKIVQFGL